ncbi:MAG: efflux RND transporter periplasmic adaptor subunit [Taibaiella sp.]|nr:efflux RND transporter periplasmic adaptor subunit [Taibaiella sp.]
MKRTAYLLITMLALASCGGKKTTTKEAKTKTDSSSRKVTAVSVTEVQRSTFTNYVNVQSQILSEENVYVAPQVALGVVKNVLVHLGQHVKKGQLLATLDAATIDQQINAQRALYTLNKTVYEKQKKLWAQQIGTEVQLLTAKAQYEASQSTLHSIQEQKRMYSFVAPISGTVDKMDLKIGDATGMNSQAIRIVNLEKLKAEANLGESYLGKVHAGDDVTLVLPDINDSLKTKITYVTQAVELTSRAFLVQVRLNNNAKLHPNMSCIMKIANYTNADAIVIPVASIQKTANGDMVYVAEGNIAKLVQVQIGKTSNGAAEILSGLNAGDKVITAGYEDLDNGQQISIQ